MYSRESEKNNNTSVKLLQGNLTVSHVKFSHPRLVSFDQIWLTTTISQRRTGLFSAAVFLSPTNLQMLAVVLWFRMLKLFGIRWPQNSQKTCADNQANWASNRMQCEPRARGRHCEQRKQAPKEYSRLIEQRMGH